MDDRNQLADDLRHAVRRQGRDHCHRCVGVLAFADALDSVPGDGPIALSRQGEILGALTRAGQTWDIEKVDDGYRSTPKPLYRIAARAVVEAAEETT